MIVYSFRDGRIRWLVYNSGRRKQSRWLACFRSRGPSRAENTDATFRGLMLRSFELTLDLNRRKTRPLVRPV